MGLMASIKGPASRSDTVVTVRLPQPACRRRAVRVFPDPFFRACPDAADGRARAMLANPCLPTDGVRFVRKG
jgi:hypothetical protein